MKSFITTFLLAILCISISSAQSFLDTTNFWKISESNPVSGFTVLVKIGDSTIINGVTYYELDWEHQNQNSLPVLYDNYFFREEGKKIYRVDAWDDFKEIMLYDFDLGVGDTLRSIYTFKIISVDSIESDQGDKKRKAWRLQYLNNPDKKPEFMVEGIGFTDAPFWSEVIIEEIICRDISQFDYGPSESYRFHCNREVISSIEDALNTEDFQIFPNPSKDHIELKLSDNVEYKIQKIQIFDSQGRLVMSSNYLDLLGGNIVDITSLYNGVYILTAHFRNGRKSVQRFIKS